MGDGRFSGTMQNVVGPTLVAMATKFWLGAEIQSPSGLSHCVSLCGSDVLGCLSGLSVCVSMPTCDRHVYMFQVFVPACVQNHWFTFNQRMTVESVTQAVSNLALQFGDDDAESGAMVRHTFLIL